MVAVSLITVTYNSAEVIRSHWNRSALPADVEWIVVDNASTDDSAQAARELGARVIRLDENLGFSAANNVGYRESTGDVVGFVNPDIVVDFSSLPRLAQISRERNCIVAPQLTNPDGSLQANGRGFPLLTAKIFNRLSNKKTRYRVIAGAGELKHVVWAIGAAVVGTRDSFDRLNGPWDPAFFVYYEDSDLGLRAWKAGVPVLLDGDSRWVHSWARETTSLKITPWKNEFRSMSTFYRRYPELIMPTAAASRAHKNAASGLSKQASGD